MREKSKFLLILAVFLGCYYLPVELLPFRGPVFESLALIRWYAREHVLLCLIPAFFIAGAICVFINQAAVIKYFGARAKKLLAYTVASVSGTILAVCSCTVLPLFSGIYKKGAGLGPAIAFLYSGPAVNILAIIMTAKVLGWQLGLARAVGAVFFSVAIGFLMHLIFLKEEKKRYANGEFQSNIVQEKRPLHKNLLYFFSMVGILIFANLSRPQPEPAGISAMLFNFKWYVVILLAAALIFMLIKWFGRNELKGWVRSSWDITKQILPLLFWGVVIAGLLLGRPGGEGLIPSGFIEGLVGGNSFFANFFASVIGAFMYFATLTEVPILQALIGAGMGKGPALALLLAGPALSLPNMLVVKSVIGARKTFVYVVLVVVMAAISGIIFGGLIK